MKPFILLLFALMVPIIAQRPRSTKYSSHDIIDYGENIGKSTEKCSNEVLLDFHYKYPFATGFLIKLQAIRDFNINSYNHCKKLSPDNDNQCLQNWQHAVANDLNRLLDDILEILPVNGAAVFERIRTDTDKCIAEHAR